MNLWMFEATFFLLLKRFLLTFFNFFFAKLSNYTFQIIELFLWPFFLSAPWHWFQKHIPCKNKSIKPDYRSFHLCTHSHLQVKPWAEFSTLEVAVSIHKLLSINQVYYWICTQLNKFYLWVQYARPIVIVVCT
jgi:hypothetical protein